MSKKMRKTNPAKTAFVLIDIQERLLPHISNHEEVVANANKLIKGAEILGIELLVTEQYPKGLGHTDKKIEMPTESDLTEKICFSCIQSDEFLGKLKQRRIKSLVLFGIETHVCVFKTALDALRKKFEVHIVADAVGSRTDKNRNIAIKRMENAGAYIVSTEMILFQMIDEAGNDTFKAISQLIK